MTYAIDDRKWGETELGRGGGLVTWSISFVGLSYNTNYYSLADFQSAVEDAFQDWEDVADIDFEPATSGSGDIHLYFAPLAGSTVGLATYWFIPSSGVDEIVEAEIEFDSTETWAPYGETDLSFFAVALHEIGHAIGLDHVDDTSEIMNPVIYANDLGDGDIEGARLLYGPAALSRTFSAGDDALDYSGWSVTVELFGMGGDDVIQGGSGDDRLFGGTGNDLISGNAGDDTIIDLSGNSTISGGADDDLIVGGFGSIDASGDEGADVLLGGIAGDILWGGAGNDVLRGDPVNSFFHGDDTLDGGAGNDLLEGGGGADVFVFRPNEGTDTIASLNTAGTRAIGADFEVGIDVIDLTGFGLSDASQIFDAITDIGGNAVFQMSGTQITIHGVTEAELNDADFIF